MIFVRGDVVILVKSRKGHLNREVNVLVIRYPLQCERLRLDTLRANVEDVKRSACHVLFSTSIYGAVRGARVLRVGQPSPYYS